MPEARIAVRLQPRARRNEIAGTRGGLLLVRVTAPPLEGRANRALCGLIADRLDVAPSRVNVIRGEHARDKLLAVEGVEQAAADARLSA